MKGEKHVQVFMHGVMRIIGLQYRMQYLPTMLVGKGEKLMEKTLPSKRLENINVIYNSCNII